MNNNTTTLEQAAEQYAKDINQNIKGRIEFNLKAYNIVRTVHSKQDFINGANWQKEQDEAKYKALLDSHNELLDKVGKLSGYFWGTEKEWQDVQLLINKAKNITNEN